MYGPAEAVRDAQGGRNIRCRPSRNRCRPKHRNQHLWALVRAGGVSSDQCVFCRSTCWRQGFAISRNRSPVPPPPGPPLPLLARPPRGRPQNKSPGRQWSCSRTMLCSVRRFVPVWPEAPFTVCASKWSRRSSSRTNLALRYVERLQVRVRGVWPSYFDTSASAASRRADVLDGTDIGRWRYRAAPCDDATALAFLSAL